MKHRASSLQDHPDPTVQAEVAYGALFEHMARGFCIIEKIETGTGEPSDFRYVAANPAFERQTGLRDPVGKTIRDLVPDAEPSIMDRYDQVVRTGRPDRFEDYVSALDLWMEAEVFPVAAPGQVAVLFNNVSDRKRAEAALRASEARQAFLLRLSDALRPLGDPAATQEAAARILGKHLGADRAYYVTLDEARQVATVEQEYRQSKAPSLVGEHAFAAYGATLDLLRAGGAVVFEDVEANPKVRPADLPAYQALGLRAFLNTPLIKDGELVCAMCVVSAEPRRWTADEVALVEETGERTWAAVRRARAEAALRESEARLRTLMEGVPQLVWRAHGSVGAWTWASPQWSAYTGQPEREAHGEGWLAAVHPEDRDACRLAWAGAPRGDGAGAFRVEHRLWHAGERRHRWVQTQALPVRDGPDAARAPNGGRVVEWLGTTTDVEDLRRGHEQRILIAELQHRTRNLLTVVSGIAEQTSATSASLAEFGMRFDQRLAALGRVQGLLSREMAPSVTVDELVRLELAAHGVEAGKDGRVTLSDPAVVLPAQAVQLLALALHELMTNALKHGALNGRGGRLAIAWREWNGPGGSPRLQLDWVESGLVPAGGTHAARQRRGFGLDLIEFTLPYELDGETRLEFTQDGVRCAIALPLDDGR